MAASQKLQKIEFLEIFEICGDFLWIGVPANACLFQYAYCRERQIDRQRPPTKPQVTYVCWGRVAANKKTLMFTIAAQLLLAVA